MSTQGFRKGKRLLARYPSPGKHEGGLIWDFPTIRGTLFWGPYNQDPIIWGGTIFGSPIFGNPHMMISSWKACRVYGYAPA